MRVPPLRTALLATAVAGVVGVARQRREAAAAARGESLPPSADAPITATGVEGRLARGLASWIPAPPSTRVGRRLAAGWSAPATVVGFGLAIASGTRPRWSPPHACWIAVGAGGISGRALRSVGAQANTIGQVVVAIPTDPPATLLAHEAVHVRQWERLGPALLVVYVWCGAIYGYRDHPLERAARRSARRTLAAG